MLGVGDFAFPLILVFHYFSGLLRHRVMTVYYANKLMDVGFRKKKQKCRREWLTAHFVFGSLCRGHISRPKGCYWLA